MAAPDSRQIYPTPGTTVTISGPKGVPLRWWCVHNLSLATVQVFGGERAAGEPLATVPAGASMALPMQERPSVTFAIPATAPEPSAGQQVIVAADAAHNAPLFAMNTAQPLSAELTGSLAPLTAAQPSLIATFNMAGVSGTTFLGSAAGVLHRNARRRTFWFWNDGINESSSILQFYPEDSVITAATGSGQTSSYGSLAWPPVHTAIPYNDFTESQVPYACDSFILAVGFATAPTTGTLKVYVVEQF